MNRPLGALVAAALLTLAGCGNFGAPPEAVTTPAAPPLTEAATPDVSPSPTAEDPAPPDTPTAAQDTPAPDSPTSAPEVARMPGGNGAALPLIVPTSALAAGWTATPARDTGYRMSVCGVDLEPNEPVDSAQANWRKGEAGPALEQHVRVYADDTAQKVVTALAEALPDCREYTAEDDGGRSAFTVEPFEVEDAVAWRQRVMVVVPGTSDVAEVVQDVAVRRVGASVVLFNSYAVGEDPDRSALTAAVASLP